MFGIEPEYLLIISGLFKSESTVSSNDEQRVRQLVLDAQFVYQRIEFPVDVSADDDVLGFVECICMENILH